MLRRPKLPMAFRERFIKTGRKGCRRVDTLLIGWWWGNRESTLSTFWFQLVWNLCACGQHTINFSYLVGGSVAAKHLKGFGSEYCLLPLRRNWRSSTLMAKPSLLSCLTVFLCSWIFSLLWLNLFLGTWGRPRRLKFFYNQGAGGGHREGRSVPERPIRVPLGDNSLFFLFLNPEEEQVWNEKGNKALDTEVNRKLRGGAQFWVRGNSVSLGIKLIVIDRWVWRGLHVLLFISFPPYYKWKNWDARGARIWTPTAWFQGLHPHPPCWSSPSTDPHPLYPCFPGHQTNCCSQR